MTPEKRKLAAKINARNFRERRKIFFKNLLKDNEELKDQICLLKLEIEMLLDLLV